MTNQGAWTNTPTASTKVKIPAGYHNGNGYVDTSTVYTNAYNKGVTDADARANASSVNYQTGYNAGVAAADGRANASSVNYQTGYNAGIADAGKAACIFYDSEPLYFNDSFFKKNGNSLICQTASTYYVFIMSSIRMTNATQGNYGIQTLYLNGSEVKSVKSVANETNSYEISTLQVNAGDTITTATTSGQQGIVVIYK